MILFDDWNLTFDGHQARFDDLEKDHHQTPATSEKTQITTMSSDVSSIEREKLAPDLKKKLDELESEVRRLQESNVDSIVTLKKLQEGNVGSNKLSNDTLINQLLVDHNLLKEEVCFLYSFCVISSLQIMVL